MRRQSNRSTQRKKKKGAKESDRGRANGRCKELGAPGQSPRPVRPAPHLRVRAGLAGRGRVVTSRLLLPSVRASSRADLSRDWQEGELQAWRGRRPRQGPGSLRQQLPAVQTATPDPVSWVPRPWALSRLPPPLTLCTEDRWRSRRTGRKDPGGKDRGGEGREQG